MLNPTQNTKSLTVTAVSRTRVPSKFLSFFDKHFTSIGKHLAKSLRGVSSWSTLFVSDVKFKLQSVTVAAL